MINTEKRLIIDQLAIMNMHAKKSKEEKLRKRFIDGLIELGYDPVYVRNNFNKLTHFTSYPRDDQRLFTWIQKLFKTRINHLYANELVVEKIPCYSIKFKHIINGQIAESIPQLAEFVGVSINDQLHADINKMITQYVAAQQPVPWSLDFDDYE